MTLPVDYSAAAAVAVLEAVEALVRGGNNDNRLSTSGGRGRRRHFRSSDGIHTTVVTPTYP